MLASPPPVPGGDRFLITAPEQPVDALQAAGFEKLGTVYLYVFNRLEEFIGRYLKGTPTRSTAGQ